MDPALRAVRCPLRSMKDGLDPHPKGPQTAGDRHEGRRYGVYGVRVPGP